MIKFSRRWSKQTQINYLERRIIVASILYYEFDWSPISDWDYEELNKQLLSLMKDYPDITDTSYGYCMYDYDGSTGFDLYSRLNKHDKEYLTWIAQCIYNVHDGKHIPPMPQEPKQRGRLF